MDYSFCEYLLIKFFLKSSVMRFIQLVIITLALSRDSPQPQKIIFPQPFLPCSPIGNCLKNDKSPFPSFVLLLDNKHNL